VVLVLSYFIILTRFRPKSSQRLFALCTVRAHRVNFIRSKMI